MEIREVRLVTSALAAQQAFYTQQLGFPLVDSTGAAFTVQAGASRLTFAQATEGEPTYHFAFNITESKAIQAHAWLRSRDIELLPDETGATLILATSWNADRLYFCDPAGNIVEFITRHNLAQEERSDTDDFTPRDVLAISEIGLPTTDVYALVDALGAALDLKVWQEPSETFTAIGDEHGLGIVVALGRSWFPTEQPSAIAPIEVTITGDPLTYYAPMLPYTFIRRPDRSSAWYAA